MRAWLGLYAAAASGLCASESLQGNDANEFAPPAYEVKQLSTRFGAKVHAVKCRVEAPRCTYDWYALCGDGTPRDVTLSGAVASAPTFIRSSDGQLMRVFVCQ